MNAIKIPIFKQNKVLWIVAKLHKNEWNVYNVCKSQKNLLTKEKSDSVQRKMSVYFKVKDELGMWMCWCEIKLN